MTEKQRLFADEYLIDLNATRAYLAVYKNVKSENVAAANASRLLRNAKIQSYIEVRLEEIKSKKIATVEEVMEYLTKVLRGEEADEVLRSSGEGVQVVDEVKVANRDRLKAAELLAKRYGLLKDQVALDVTVPVFKGEEHLED